MFHSEKILAEGVDGVFSPLEAFNLGNMSQFASATTVFIVLDVLVWIDYLDHFLFLLVFKLINTRLWMKGDGEAGISP